MERVVLERGGGIGFGDLADDGAADDLILYRGHEPGEREGRGYGRDQNACGNPKAPHRHSSIFGHWQLRRIIAMLPVRAPGVLGRPRAFRN
jgi:hypothetical protein